MMRNDYRRSLILLRSNGGGYSGHVRLERRTLTGSLNFLVQAPTGAQRLEAALVGTGRNGVYACPLGTLRRDSRGQAALNFTFDPRSICGRELEDYAILAVVEAADCRVVLFGNVNGHSEIDWRQARTALRRLYAAEDGETAEIVEAAEETAGESLPEIAAAIEPDAPQTAAEETPPEPEEIQPCAGELLKMDLDVPWQESVEALRAIFREKPAADPAPDADFVYVSAPMPAESGYGEILAGIRAEGGAPVAVRYALPAPWSAEPPAGLEDFTWSGDSNRGWWVTEADL